MDIARDEPLYIKTKTALREYLSASKCVKLPGERKLVEKLGVSMTTVRKAIQDMINEGRLRSVHGKGTFVVGGSRKKSVGASLLVFDANLGPYQKEAFQLLTKCLVQKKVCAMVLMVDDLGLAAEQIAPILKKVDSVVLGSRLSEIENVHNVLAGSGKKVVVLRHKPHLYDYDFIEEDRELAFRLITEHLLSLGHRRVATLIYQKDARRLRGIQNAFAARGLEMPEDISINCPGLRHAAYDAAGELLAKSRDFTAVIAHSDTAALGVMERFFREGIRIPEEVSVTGFDNLAESAQYPVPLTSCGADLEQMARMLVEFICGEKGDLLFQKIVAPVLCVRNSTAAVRSHDKEVLTKTSGSRKAVSCSSTIIKKKAGGRS